jgi:chromosome segregation ATPase
MTISLCDQIAGQFDESSRDLEKILKEIPKEEKRSIKSKLTEENSIFKEEKRHLDALEKERSQVKNDLDQIRKNLGNCRLHTRKHNKLQERQKSLIEDRKRLKQQIQKQQETYRQAQKQYRINIEYIYQQSQKKELERLQNISKPLENFVTALLIDPSLLQKAIEKHNPQTDLASWKEKHFSSSFN